MSEFFFEILSEEIPARMQEEAEDNLQYIAAQLLNNAGILASNQNEIKVYSTPRRLVLYVPDLALEPINQEPIERKGPRTDAAATAIEGFLRSAGLKSLDQCEKRDTGKGEFWFALIKPEIKQTIEILPEIIQKILDEFSWPKSMRWGRTAIRWVRPLHDVMAMFNGQLLQGSWNEGGYFDDVDNKKINFLDKNFVSETVGHRFLSKTKIQPKDFAEYKKQLEENYVLLSRGDRAERIKREAEKLAAKEGLTLALDDALLEEITGLVEWPVILIGSFDESYLSVPKEVLITTMRVNQKYIPLLKPDSSLANKFIITSNMVATDGGKKIIAGNERVLRARLSDAKFFYEQDLKVKLADRVDALKNITFHDKIGSMYDKVQRVVSLAGQLAPLIGADAKTTEYAARLAKADLTSGMVGEFPELQGIMGGYYAAHGGEAKEIANAVRDHYLPLGPNTSVPTEPVAIAVSLADKIDTLTEFFRIGEKPTGSKDPYALRRAALGIIRIILENNLRIELKEFFSVEVAVFLLDRFKVVLKEQGLKHDSIDSVIGAVCDSDLVQIVMRIRAVQNFLATDTGVALQAGYKRATNILGIEEKKDKTSYDGQVQENFAAPEEKALYQSIKQIGEHIQGKLANDDFTGAMNHLALLRPSVDAFFDKVLVNDPEPNTRRNRLQLLAFLRNTMNQIADFSKIEG